MAERERARLFEAAGLLVVGAAVLLVLIGEGHGPAPAERERATIAAPIVQGGSREQRSPGPPPQYARTAAERAASEDRAARSRAAGRELERAEVAARAFLSALLRREGESQARRGIARRATADFAHFVLKGKPRAPAATEAPARARLVDVEPIGLSHGRAGLAATMERDGTRSGLLVTLARREGRWLVADLR
jgi:hypothetical protein